MRRRFKKRDHQPSNPGRFSDLESSFVEETARGLAYPLHCVRHPILALFQISGALAMLALIVVSIDMVTYAADSPTNRDRAARSPFQQLTYGAVDGVIDLKNKVVKGGANPTQTVPDEYAEGSQ